MAKSVSTGFPVLAGNIELRAYKEMYEAGVMPRIVTEIAKGSKGTVVQWPYFDPTTLATGASTAAEANDFSTTTALINASKTVVASEFVERADLTDTSNESSTEDLTGVLGKYLGYGMAHKVDAHILARMSTGFTTGTITGTNSTTGFTFLKYAAARSILDAKALTVPTPYIAAVPTYSWYWTASSTVAPTYGSAMGSIGDAVVNKYYVSRILGDIDVYRLPVSYVTAATAAVGFLYAKDAVGFWNPRPIRVEKQRDASARADEYVASVRGGATVLIPGFGARLRMFAQAPS